jgi:hypothetical protein
VLERRRGRERERERDREREKEREKRGVGKVGCVTESHLVELVDGGYPISQSSM